MIAWMGITYTDSKIRQTDCPETKNHDHHQFARYRPV